MTNPAVDNIRAIVELQRQAARERRRSERIGEAITAVAGTLAFVLVHFVAFVAWAAWNRWAPQPWQFDPYPYGLLTFMVSLEGVLVATFVLIAQNRMTRQTEERDHLNLQIDLLAEQEMTLVLRILRQITDKLGIPPATEDDRRAQELAEQTNVYDLMQTIRKEIPNGDE